MPETSTRPYLIRAIHEWCTDNGLRPFLAVAVDSRTVVPREFVRGGEIVLNLSIDATNRLQMRNDLIEFEARFGGVARQVSIPVENVTAIYAAENGQGMSFDPPAMQPDSEAIDAPESASLSGGPIPVRSPALLEPVPAPAEEPPTEPDPPPAPPRAGRPHLTRVK